MNKMEVKTMEIQKDAPQVVPNPGVLSKTFRC